MEEFKIVAVAPDAPLSCDWNDPVWAPTAMATLPYHMGTEPTHKPLVEFRLAYDTDALRVIFRVHDHYIKAVAEGYHDAVCRDSCVEWFFSPGADVSLGYFNFEFNCCGVMLARFQPAPGVDMQDLTQTDCDAVQVVRSIDTDSVDPELVGDHTWTLAARIPLSVLKTYAPHMTMPEAGVAWRGNIYKCADKTSGPHWLTWAKIDWDGPNFHLPQFFGQLNFD
jgi:hypothetical protein